MEAYRYSLIITGENFNPNNCENLLKEFPLHIYSKWSNGDKYFIGNKPYKYNYSGVIIIHDYIYATNEREIRTILDIYLLFLEKNQLQLKTDGASDFELSISTYLCSNSIFILMLNNELRRFLSCENVVIRCEILYYEKYKYNQIVNKMKKERILREKLSCKKNKTIESKHIFYYLRTEVNVPCSLGWDANEINNLVNDNRDIYISVCH